MHTHTHTHTHTQTHTLMEPIHDVQPPLRSQWCNGFQSRADGWLVQLLALPAQTKSLTHAPRSASFSCISVARHHSQTLELCVSEWVSVYERQREIQPLGKPPLSGRSFPAGPLLRSIPASRSPPSVCLSLAGTHTLRKHSEIWPQTQSDQSSCFMAVAWSVSERKGILI